MAKLKIGNAESEVSAIDFDGKFNSAVIDFKKDGDPYYVTKMEMYGYKSGQPGALNSYELRFYINEMVEASPKTLTIPTSSLSSATDGWSLATGIKNITVDGAPASVYSGSVDFNEGDVKVVDVDGNKKLGWMLNGSKQCWNSGSKITSTGDTIEAGEHLSDVGGTLTPAQPAHYVERKKCATLSNFTTEE